MAWTPPKTDFASGNILTAAQMNAIGENLLVLGVRLVKTQTIGSGVSDVTVTGAFSADYDNYLVTVTNVDFSGTNNFFYIRLGTSTTRTEYAWGSVEVNNNTGGVTGNGTLSTANGVPISYTEDDEVNVSLSVMAPFLAQPKNFFSLWGNASYGGIFQGYDALASSQTQFVIRPASGTMTGGTIRVYGYINS